MIPIISGDTMRLTFNRYDQDAYRLFLRTKSLPEHEIVYDEFADAYTVVAPSRFAELLGFQLQRSESDWLPMPSFLFDRQSFFVRKALEAKRYACWWDTGLGKTLLILEWARQVQSRTSGKVLIVELLNVIPEVLSAAKKFYGDELTLQVISTRDELRAWCANGAPGIAITNPEKFIPREREPEAMTEVTHCVGVALDESSILKTGGGVIKWALSKSCRGVEYKLSCTATPAPNDPIEYASQAAWLEKIRDENDVIWTYFARDKDGEWKVKEHALAAFYAFLSNWSCYLRDPRRYGFVDGLADLPEPETIVHDISATAAQLAELSALPSDTGQRRILTPKKLGIVERTRMATLSSGFVYEGEAPRNVRRVASNKIDAIARITAADVADGRQIIIWTEYDATADAIAEALSTAEVRAEVLTGTTPKPQREPIVDRFTSGATPVIITRPKMLAFGRNLQCCSSMIFADITDSYERIYQAIRRAYRYGNPRRVRIHHPIVRELQGVTWDNVQLKARQFAGDVEKMETLFIEAMRDELARRAA